LIIEEMYMNELIEKRHSVRKFDPHTPVTKEQLKALLEAAMMAPSAKNKRSWEFIAVTRREVLDEIARINPNAAMCATATAAIIVVGIPQPEIPSDFVPQDCAAATQNILLEAVALGLGTCWCGVYPNKDKVPLFSKLFDIKEPKYPFNIIAVGKPAEVPKSRGFYDESKVKFIE